MPHSLYPNLLSPLKVAHLELKNRVLMGSMHVGLEDDRKDLSKLAAYFAERARGEVGLIVTGGVAPNKAGWAKPFAATMASKKDADKHRVVADAVHAEGGRIAMQILHTGRYAYHPLPVAPSAKKSPISPFPPRGLTGWGVRKTIDDFVRCATLAKEAGYDGVEIMGSEGYLINQFIAARTNHRKDEWGGPYENRMRFPVEIVRKTREAVGDDFILIYRLSMLDLVDGGSTWDEVVQLGKAIEEAGASIINTGIGWHEARIPTIATMVPRGAFTWVTRKLQGDVDIPLITSNRINDPQVAEDILARGDAQMVSMARPLLADPHFVKKARESRAEEINTCIACNQACLDHIFQNKRASCLVNPQACYETELVYTKATTKRTFAVVGAGPAGLSFACVAAERGHTVHLFDKSDSIGGQLNLARKVPGKEEFDQTIRYFEVQTKKLGVKLHLGKSVDAKTLAEGDYDAVVVAAGVHPRQLKLEGIEHESVLSYVDAIQNPEKIGKRVALIGAGGIGFDVAELLCHDPEETSTALDLEAWLEEWGIEDPSEHRAGLAEPKPPAAAREVFLCQRTAGKPGANLGKTTGWIHRTTLKHRKVKMLAGVTYERIDDEGLHIRLGDDPVTLAVDNVVVCAGQVPNRDLVDDLLQAGQIVHVIGGADEARELDAKRAIGQAARLAAHV